MSSKYKCAECLGEFDKGWSDEEAKAEQVANGFGDYEPDDLAVVCDDCYQSIAKRLESYGMKLRT